MSNPSAKPQPRLKERVESICLEMIDSGILFCEAVEQFENCFMTEVLRRNNGHLQNAAKALGIHRNTLAKRMALLKAKRAFRQSGLRYDSGTSGPPKINKDSSSTKSKT